MLAEFACPGPVLKQTPGIEACTCDPSSGEAEAGGSPGLTGQAVYLSDRVPGQDILSRKVRTAEEHQRGLLTQTHTPKVMVRGCH